MSSKLTNEEISRYSRQMILPELGLKGQKNLKNGSVLIVGLGGLGSPASIFLASSGIGKLGLVDYDSVEISNLHRQIIHNEKTIGMSKSKSAKAFINALNSNVDVEVFDVPFTNSNALDIIKKYDLILDCTDNAATRYLLNDSCVLEKKPLVSGSALRFEGQLITYNFKGGPCYRCLFPIPPPPEFVTNCSDGGVLGAVPGTIGTLQALEAIKIISGLGSSYNGKMLLFNGLQGTFQDVKLRSKQSSCAVCGENPTITSLLEDYVNFCGAGFDDKEKCINILKKEERISPIEFSKIIKSKPFLIDVREPQELEICSLPNVTFNIPFSSFDSDKGIEPLKEVLSNNKNQKEVYVVCRRGNDSQRAVKVLKEKFPDSSFKDIEGGLHKWTQDVDNEFPVY